MDVENKLSQRTMKTQKVLFGGQVFLRVIAAGTALAAAYTMFTCKQTVFTFGFYLSASWSYSPAFKYVAYADAVACGCCALSLIVAIAVGRPGSNPSRYFVLFLHDLVMVAAMAAACAAGTSVGWIGKYGNEHTGWMSICDKFAKYCNRVTISLILSYASCLCFLLLAILSANQSRQILV